MAGSVFGLGGQLDVQAASLSLIAIVIFTIGFEVFTHHLDHYLEGTAYKEMVDKIYQELTILGLISFGVFIFLQSPAKDEVPSNIIIAFEFSHIVIFFSAMFFVMEAFFMMVVNSNLKVRVDQSAAKTSKEIVDEYNARKAEVDAWSEWVPRKFTTMMEYKVFNIFFCEQYQLPLSVFDFPCYIREVLDKQVVNLIEVDISSWLFLVVFLIFNTIRAEVIKEDTSSSGSHRRLHEVAYDAFFDPSPDRRLGAAASDTVACCDAHRRLHFVDYDEFFADGRYLGASDTSTPSCPETDSSSTNSSSYGSRSLFLRLLGASDTASVDCACTDAAAAHRRLGGATEEDPCATYGPDGIVGFALAGWAMFIFVFCLAIFSRRCELRLLQLIGLNDTSEYAKYISDAEKKLQDHEAAILLASRAQEEEDDDESPEKPRHLRATRNSFDKQQMLAQMKAMHTHGATDHMGDDHGGHGGHGDGHGGGHGHGHTDETLEMFKKGGAAFASKVGVTAAAKKLAKGIRSPNDHNKGKDYVLLKRDTVQEPQPEGALVEGDKKEVNFKEAAAEPDKKSTEDGKRMSLADLKVPAGGGVKIHPGGEEATYATTHNTELKAAANEFLAENDSHGIQQVTHNGVDLSSVYPFRSPLLFTKSLDMILLFNTFYLAVFVANYVIVIFKKHEGTEQLVYFVITLLPALLLYPCVVVCVRTTSILNAISVLDVEIVGKVIDETEDMLNIQHEVFDVFRNKMEAKGLGPSDLQKLFLEIDADGSGEIDAKELKTGLHTIGMHFSKNKFKRLFRAVDRDRSGNISFPEFFHLVYPEEPIPGDDTGEVKNKVMGLEAILNMEAESVGFK